MKITAATAAALLLIAAPLVAGEVTVETKIAGLDCRVVATPLEGGATQVSTACVSQSVIDASLEEVRARCHDGAGVLQWQREQCVERVLVHSSRRPELYRAGTALAPAHPRCHESPVGYGELLAGGHEATRLYQDFLAASANWMNPLSRRPSCWPAGDQPQQ